MQQIRCGNCGAETMKAFATKASHEDAYLAIELRCTGCSTRTRLVVSATIAHDSRVNLASPGSHTTEMAGAPKVKKPRERQKG